MGNVQSFSKILYDMGMIFIPTLLGKPKLITLSVNPKYPGQPIIYEINSSNLKPTSSFIKDPYQNGIYTYIGNTSLEEEIIFYKALQLNPLTNKMEIITIPEEMNIIFGNYTPQQINDMSKTIGTFTFDNISFDGDNWQLGTISSNYFIGPIIPFGSNTHIYELGSYISSIQPPQIIYSFYNTITQQRSLELLDTDISQCPVNIDIHNIDTFIACFNNSFSKIQILDANNTHNYNPNCIYLTIDDNKLIRSTVSPPRGFIDKIDIVYY